jgi:tRNA(Ile)-lysidine synthase TilS/MesJ
MRPKSVNPCGETPVIRPLLCTTHDYIVHYLRDIRHIDWVEDSTNSDTSIRRNSIREELKQYQKAEIEHIAQTARIMQGYVDWMEGKDTLVAREVQKYEKDRQ